MATVFAPNFIRTLSDQVESFDGPNRPLGQARRAARCGSSGKRRNAPQGPSDAPMPTRPPSASTRINTASDFTLVPISVRWRRSGGTGSDMGMARTAEIFIAQLPCSRRRGPRRPWSGPARASRRHRARQARRQGLGPRPARLERLPDARAFAPGSRLRNHAQLRRFLGLVSSRRWLEDRNQAASVSIDAEFCPLSACKIEPPSLRSLGGCP